MNNFKWYIDKHKNRFIKELKDFLSIPSISTHKFNVKYLHEAAFFLKKKLEIIGMNNIKIYNQDTIPILYGEKIIDNNLPTILIYGHYDVQDPNPISLWDSDPFDPIIKTTCYHPEGAIFARGATDNKGQIYMYLKALEVIQYYNYCACNLKIIIEGEEEIGSKGLINFIIKNKNIVNADVVLISDTTMIGKNKPSITVSLRGITGIEIEISNKIKKDLHSGINSGNISNPINVIANIISSISDINGNIIIPEFYKNTKYLNVNKQYDKTASFDSVLHPSIDFNGISGGYINQGLKTIIPYKATLKLTSRIVYNQTYQSINKIIIDHIKKIIPSYANIHITKYAGSNPVFLPQNSYGYKIANKALKKVFNTIAQPIYSGGTIPIVDILHNDLNIDVILIGFGLPSDNLHAPNEHYGLDNFFKGIETIIYFIKYYKL